MTTSVATLSVRPPPSPILLLAQSTDSAALLVGMLQQWEDMPEASLSTAVAPNYDEMANRQLATMFYTETRVLATEQPTRHGANAAPCDPMIAQMAKEIIANLEAAAGCAETRVQKYHNQPCRELGSSLAQAKRNSKSVGWFELWKYRVEVASSFLAPMQFMAGLVVGVALGVAFAKRLALHHERIRQNALAKSLYRYTSDTGSNELAASRCLSSNVPFSMEDMSYLLHHPAIDVS